MDPVEKLVFTLATLVVFIVIAVGVSILVMPVLGIPVPQELYNSWNDRSGVIG